MSESLEFKLIDVCPPNYPEFDVEYIYRDPKTNKITWLYLDFDKWQDMGRPTKLKFTVEVLTAD